MTAGVDAMEMIPGVNMKDLDFLIETMAGVDHSDVITLLAEWMLEDEKVSYFIS